MRQASANVLHMSKMIQIRNVPDDVHRRLKIRAAEEGQSLSDYLLREVVHFATLPSLREMRERLTREESIDIGPEEIVRAIHEGREERDEAIWRTIGGDRWPDHHRE